MNDKLARWEKAKAAILLATTVDEVKEIRDKAEALRQYAKRAGECLEVQNNVCEIKLRAERRMGEMIPDAVHAGQPKKELSHDSTFLSDLGISRNQSSRYQAMAKLPEDKFDEHIERVKAANEELTTAGVLRLAQGPHVANNSGENEWYTPKVLIEAAREVLGSIDCDPASSDLANETIKAKKFWTIEDDGRKQKWGKRVWMNPPYAQPLCNEFCAELVKRVNEGEVEQACVLVNNATETVWFQDMLVCASALCLLRGRVKFIDKDGNPSGAPLQGQAILYFGGGAGKFAKAMNGLGVVLYPG